MLVDVDPRDPRPVFRQIVDEVHRSLAAGILKPEDALPPVRQLAAELNVNANTVQHAYRTLEGEGTAYVKRGIGTFIAATAVQPKGRQQTMARQIAERMLREGFRYGLLAGDLIAALEAIGAPMERPLTQERAVTSARAGTGTSRIRTR
jgi:GntR family transcriptional regulator